MASAVSRLCQRCGVGLRTGYPVTVTVKMFTRGYHLSTCVPVSASHSQPLHNKHTWLPHEQVPNKFVTMYRDIHGPKLFNEAAAREFVFALDHEERDRLLSELNKFTGEQSTQESHVKPTASQLRLVCLHQTLPFIGFGFLDNFLMIVAGEYIDVTLGATLGISTMAAAGLGNMISDVGGVGSAYYVELAVAKLGVRTPRLTPSQVDMKSTRWASSLGKVLGVAIGCILGMCPLLFFDQDRDKDKDKGKDKGKDKDKSSSKSEDSTKQAVVQVAQTAAKDGTPCASAAEKKS